MQDIPNYYELLGVKRDASADEIKQSFRRLARQYHPDLNPGDKAAEDKFKDISEAYEILSDRSKRSQYDKFTGFWRKNRTKASPSQPREPRDRSNDEEEFGDDFNTFIDRLLGRKKESASSSNRDRTSRSEASADRPNPTSLELTMMPRAASVRLRDSALTVMLPLVA